MRALSCSLAAARAIHCDQDSAWERYKRLAVWIWNGEVDRVLEYLDQEQARLGGPPKGASKSDPGEILRGARVYYRNHRGRMYYPLCRQNGYPLTHSIMESTVKQVSRRVKGTEKFWSEEGDEALLQLRGDYLSSSQPIETHWRLTPRSADGLRAYGLSA